MAFEKTIKLLTNQSATPSVTISMNTHRTHPDSEKDAITLKNLVSEANDLLGQQFDKRKIETVLDKLAQLEQQIDVNYGLDSLHIFISRDVNEVVKLPWPTKSDAVYVSDSFVVRPLVKASSRSEEYTILLLSQSGAKLFHALDQSILSEIDHLDFPTNEKPPVSADPEVRSDPKKTDNVLREYFNKIDKALVGHFHQTNLKTVCICTESNYGTLLEVADKPDMYYGHQPIDYHKIQPNQLVDQAWALIRHHQKARVEHAIQELAHAVGQGMVVTDLDDIFRAAKEGRGQLLFVHESYSQPALVEAGGTSGSIFDNSQEVDDMISDICVEIISKDGQVIFTESDQIQDFGQIALKTRY